MRCERHGGLEGELFSTCGMHEGVCGECEWGASGEEWEESPSGSPSEWTETEMERREAEAEKLEEWFTCWAKSFSHECTFEVFKAEIESGARS